MASAYQPIFTLVSKKTNVLYRTVSGIFSAVVKCRICEYDYLSIYNNLFIFLGIKLKQ
jgi:hypothetical protein